MRYAVFRLMDYKPGCVDFLGEVDADSEEAAEKEYAHLLEEGERLDVQEDSGETADRV